MTVTAEATTDVALADGVTSAAHALAALADLDVGDVAGQGLLDALDALEVISRTTEALTARVLAGVEAQGLWALAGARSMAAWYRARSGRTAASARAKVTQARAMRSTVPAAGAALAHGQISPDHVTALIRHAATTPRLREELEHGELGQDWLVEQAKGLDGTAFTTLVKAWATRVDPDAADRGYVEETGREEFHLSETAGGYVPGGWLTREHGQVLAEALAARTGTPVKDDQRRPSQRRAAALVALARLTLDSGVLRPGARIRPHLSVHVPFDTLARLVAATAPAHRPGCPAVGTAAHGPAIPGAAFGPAAPPGAPDGCSCFTDADAVITADLDSSVLAGAEPATLTDGTPLAPSQLARLACASNLHRVVFGPEGEVLDVGREHRLFTAAQTRAIIARDRHCVFPDCDAPPGEGEVHHTAWWWAHGGKTSIDTGALACWHHHDYIHTHHIRIERHGGTWVLYRRDGTTIEPRRARPG